MQTATLLINPRARRAGDVARREAFVGELAKTHRVTVVIPASADDTTRCARDAAAGGADVVIAGGGDGTMNAAARALAGSAIPLALFPLGSANDLARELGVPNDPVGAATRAAAGTARVVDVVRVGDDGALFVGVGGLALVSRSALGVSRAKEKSSLVRAAVGALGGSVYQVSATANLLLGRGLDDTMRIAIDDAAPFELLCAAVFVTNHHTTGGGLVIPAGAVPDDGVCEICVVPARSRTGLALNFARLSAGVALPDGVLVAHRGTRAVIETAHDDAFVADGELLASGRRFTLRLDPRALTLRA